MKSPKTLFEFHALFPDEQACWSRLRRARWPRGFRCPRCAGQESYAVRERRLEQCRACRYQASVTAGTVLHGTRIPLRTWFLAIFLLARRKKGTSALQFQRDSGLGSYQSAWTLLHKVRSALHHPPSFRLEGLVEVDETYVGARNERGMRGGRQTRRKAIVAVAVENRGKQAGALRLSVVPGVSQADLEPFVRGVVDAARARIHTDTWGGYAKLNARGVSHRAFLQGHPSRAPSILPWAHTVASNLKTWLRGTFHGVSRKHLQPYLEEFVYRFNRRTQDDELFDRVLQRVVSGDPFPYARLVAEPVG